MTNLKEKFIEKFNFYEAGLNGERSTDLFKIRKNAIDIFNKNGFPTIRHEDWKYTNLAFLNKIDFTVEPKPAELYEEQINDLLLPGAGENRLIFINGKLYEKFSKLENTNIEIKSISKAFKENPEDIAKYYGKIADKEKLNFAALNTAMSHEGAFIKAGKNKQDKAPIQIIHFLDSSEDPIFINKRNLIIAEESSELNIYQTTVTVGDNEAVYNICTEVFCGKNSKANLYNIQNDSSSSHVINCTSAYQEKDSVFSDFTITIDGRFVRNDLRTKLDGENITSNYWGLYLLNGNQHADNHTFVDHAKPHCNSNEFYKGILDDRSKGVFNGKVLVARDAQKTDAYQQNRNLVLSDFASMNTKPELEIYADDVKCSHGATTGMIDEDVLFYMRQRGIAEKEARAIIQYVFLMEIVDKIEITELREYIGDKIKKKLGVEI